MRIRFACPACSQSYTAHLKLAGRELICRKCGLQMVIPEQTGSSQSAPPDPDSVEVDPTEVAGQPKDSPLDFASSTQPAASPRQDLASIPEVLPISPPPRRSFSEILLDPRTIYLLLLSGASLLVLGIVTLLYVNDLLTPALLAVILGPANVAVLGAGLYLRRYTRYAIAGMALTLLACGVMPLNLWYYHVNDLLTFGDYLWVPALIISALYFTSAVVLRDERFVYVFVAGVALTGLLIIADLPPSPQRFWETAFPATWLVLLGLAAVHTERAFLEGDGPFSRSRFGKAFFHAGLLSLAVGLLMILIAYIGGDWGYEALFKSLYEAWETQPSPIVSEQRWLALLLILAGIYAAFYSDAFVLKSVRLSLVVPALLVWATVVAYQAIGLKLTPEVVAITLAGFSVPQSLLRIPARDYLSSTRLFAIQALLLLLIALAVVFYKWSYAYSVAWEDAPGRIQLAHHLTWSLPLALVVIAGACRVSFEACRWDRPLTHLEPFTASLEAMALLIAASASLSLLGVEPYLHQAVILMAIPLGYIASAYAYQETNLRSGIRVGAYVAMALILCCGISALESLFAGARQTAHLFWALLFAMTAAFFALVALLDGRMSNLIGSAFGLGAALWQLAAFLDLPTQYIWTVTTSVALGLVAYQRFAADRGENASEQLSTLERIGHVVGLVACLGVALMIWFNLIAEGLALNGVDSIHWVIVGSLQALLAGVGTNITTHQSLRRLYGVGALILVALTIMSAVVLFDLSFWQKVELASVLIGLALLALGHYAWYLESEREDPVATLALLFGSLFFGVPLAIATWVDRYKDVFHILNEVGFLAGAVLLLLIGLILRLKATTIVGGTLTALYFLTFLIFVPWTRMSFLAILMIVGGTLVFLVGLGLSIFRERLLALPGQIQRREGVFRVLDWR